jgi:hypothetical protein
LHQLTPRTNIALNPLQLLVGLTSLPLDRQTLDKCQKNGENITKNNLLIPEMDIDLPRFLTSILLSARDLQSRAVKQKRGHKTENRLLFLLLFCFLCFKSNSQRMQKSRNSTKEREKHMFKKILLLPEMDLHLLSFFTSSSMSAHDRQIYSRKPKSSAQNRT